MRNLSLLFSLVVLTILAACSPKAQQPGAANIIRVMSYNIHHCNPPSKKNGEIDLDAIAAVIKKQKPDLVALQEVDVNTARSGKVNQAAEIAEKLGMHYYFAKAIDYEGGEYGTAVLSRFPLIKTETIKLPNPELKEQRVVALAEVSLPGGTVVRFGSTHLEVGSAVNREVQIKEINRIAGAGGAPFIIAGDFNAMPGSVTINLLDERFQRTCSSCEPTIPVINPKRAIDFIAFTPVSRFKVISHEVIPERYASDHLPVVSVIQY